MDNPQGDPYKQKFRSDADTALDREVEAALGGMSVEDLYDFDKPQTKPEPGGLSAAKLAKKGMRRGRIVRIDDDDVFVDFGGKSQGIASLLQFDTKPEVGQELDFSVERYDEREGLLILTRKGAASSNVSWQSLEIGQVIEGTVTGMNKGGLELEFKGMRAFMPAGQVDLYFTKDISTFIGQKMLAEVTQFDREARI